MRLARKFPLLLENERNVQELFFFWYLITLKQDVYSCRKKPADFNKLLQLSVHYHLVICMSRRHRSSPAASAARNRSIWKERRKRKLHEKKKIIDKSIKPQIKERKKTRIHQEKNIQMGLKKGGGNDLNVINTMQNQNNLEYLVLPEETGQTPNRWK